MIKLIEGNSNWDYFLTTDNLVVAIAKVQGCDDCHFGTIGYIDKMLIQHGYNYLGEITHAGLKCLQLNRERQGYSNLKYEYLQAKNPIDFYTEVKGV